MVVPLVFFNIVRKLRYLLRFIYLYDNMRLCFVHFQADWILKVFFSFGSQKVQILPAWGIENLYR